MSIIMYLLYTLYLCVSVIPRIGSSYFANINSLLQFITELSAIKMTLESTEVNKVFLTSVTACGWFSGNVLRTATLPQNPIYPPLFLF